MRRLVVIALLAASSTQSAPQLFIAANSGMNLSFYKAAMPEFLSIEERAVSLYPLFGASLELKLHEFFRISLGAMAETREGILKGKAYLRVPEILLGLGEMVNGQYDYTLSYLQIPLQIKIVVPLLIPGDVFGAAGPEIGINTGQDLMVTVRLPNDADARIPLDIKDSVETLDAGIGFSLGYEFPIGRSANAGLSCGYYLGLRDICRMSAVNDQDVREEYDLYTRSIRFSLIFCAGFGG